MERRRISSSSTSPGSMVSNTRSRGRTEADWAQVRAVGSLASSGAIHIAPVPVSPSRPASAAHTASISKLMETIPYPDFTVPSMRAPWPGADGRAQPPPVGLHPGFGQAHFPQTLRYFVHKERRMGHEEKVVQWFNAMDWI